jgi:hypothetical protein
MSTQDFPTADAGHAREEYRSLRRTIQSRGSLRIAIALATWTAWATLALWAWTSVAGPVAGLIPLLILVGGFELVLSLHTGVERIGRYVQRMFETGRPSPPAWEHVAVAMGPRWLSPGGLDPLFSLVFLFASWLNLVPSVLSGDVRTLVVIGVPHAAFIIRVIVSRQFIARQRAADLAALESVISSNSLVSKIQQ